MVERRQDRQHWRRTRIDGFTRGVKIEKNENPGAELALGKHKVLVPKIKPARSDAITKEKWRILTSLYNKAVRTGGWEEYYIYLDTGKVKHSVNGQTVFTPLALSAELNNIRQKFREDIESIMSPEA